MAKFITDATYDASYGYATKEYTHHKNRPCMFRARAVFPNAEEAKEFASLLPKYVGIKVSKDGVINFYAGFSRNEVTGDKNETAIKRLKKFLSVAEIEWKSSHAINVYASLEEFMANI